MKTQSSENKWVGAGVLAAVAASLCCITPVLALLVGTSGLASTFSWMEPFRPYLIGLTAVVLGFAWHQKLKPKKAVDIDCDCEEDDKPLFIQSKTFLGLVTVLAAVMLAFPMYAHIFYPDNSKEVTVINQSDIQTASFEIRGMTCAGCEEHVKHGINELEGIVEAAANFRNGTASVKFDGTKTTLEEIKEAIDATGYKVTKYQMAENQ